MDEIGPGCGGVWLDVLVAVSMIKESLEFACTATLKLDRRINKTLIKKKLIKSKSN